MDFQIPEHIQQRAREARTWVEEVLDPLSADLEEKEIFPPALYEELKRGKFFGVTIPREYGGEGLPMTQWYPLLEEFSRGYAFVRMMAHCMNGLMWRAIYFFGKDDHKRELLPKMARGEIMVANCLTEPESGTGKDIDTQARKVGQKWIINGHKWLITVFPDLVPCFYIVFANTENGVTCFGVRDDNPGLKLAPMQKMMGTQGPRHFNILFKDCEVDEADILGVPGQGLRVAFDMLALSRVSIAACCVGVAQKMLDLCVPQAKHRHTFGKPLAKRQAIQWSLAEMATSINAGRGLYQKAAWLYEQNRPYDMEASMAKLFTEEMVVEVAEKALRMHGGFGYTKGTPVERFFRDCRSFHFEEGTAEIQKLVIARGLLK
ncbi:MAG: acyl-CoA dehydrogenase family protein [Desulfohalobiaceae bacterium]|nr:acyl-CoA dehydrogenase family protein [Desulfohalobiaceae bacterium]